MDILCSSQMKMFENKMKRIKTWANMQQAWVNQYKTAITMRSLISNKMTTLWAMNFILLEHWIQLMLSILCISFVWNEQNSRKNFRLWSRAMSYYLWLSGIFVGLW